MPLHFKVFRKIDNNRGLKRISGLFAERSKWEVFSKGPRSKQLYDRLLLGIQIPQVAGPLHCIAFMNYKNNQKSCSLNYHYLIRVIPSIPNVETLRLLHTFFRQINKKARIVVNGPKFMKFGIINDWKLSKRLSYVINSNSLHNYTILIAHY